MVPSKLACMLTMFHRIPEFPEAIRYQPQAYKSHHLQHCKPLIFTDGAGSAHTKPRELYAVRGPGYSGGSLLAGPTSPITYCRHRTSRTALITVIYVGNAL